MSSDSDDTMRSPGASETEAPALDDIIAQRETALRVYDDTRTAFYAWEQEHARTTLARLARPAHRPPPPLPTPDPDADWPREALFLPDSDSSDAADEEVIYFDVDSYNPHTGGKHTRVRTASVVQRVAPFNPYPRYTMCTPASRSVPMRGGGAAGGSASRAAYAPFADDASFDVRGYLAKFDELAWQTDKLDPNLQIIEYDTARRLHFQHHLSLDAIDALNIFDDTPVRIIIRGMSQRDYLRWPGSQLDTLPMFTPADASPSTAPAPATLYDQLTHFLPSFCANLNCLMPFCKLHPPMPAFVPPVPHLTAEMIREMDGEPCGAGCYKHTQDDDMNTENAHWDEADHALFESVIKLTPDTAPCDLAVICRKSCIEMYVARLRSIPDAAVHPAPDPKAKPKKPNIKFVEDVLSSADTDSSVRTPHPVGPCAHAGPCSRHAVDCVCAASAQRCMRTCRCASTCALRFPGCRCKPRKRKPLNDSGRERGKGKGKGRARDDDDDADWAGDGGGGGEEGAGGGGEYEAEHIPCADDTCPCKAHGRECDPELCVGCGARRAHGKCRNRSLQQGESHPIHVKASKFGLGAFAVSAIPKDACVGEYVGEIAEGDVPFLPQLQHHVKLNYVFELSQSYDARARALPGTERIIDSWNLGNATRFLNHPEEPQPANCGARTLLVNGVHRIGIYALNDIKAGQELTLDYGENYWGATAPESRRYKEDDYDPANIRWPGWYNA